MQYPDTGIQIQHPLSRAAEPALPDTLKTADRCQLPDLPIELWLYIYDMVPHPHQRNMLGINRMLFQMIMSELHAEAGFVTSDPHVLFTQLESFQSSILSRYVRVLTLRPGSIREALGKYEEPVQPEPTQSLHRGHSYTSNSAIRRLHQSKLPSFKLSDIIRRFLAKHTISTQQVELPPPPPNKCVQMFTTALQNLTHVEKFELVWPQDFTLAGYHWEFDFFPEVWRAIGRNLTKLSIDINTFKLGDVIKDSGPLPQLEELHLSLRYDILDGTPDEALVPSFINRFAVTLRHLSIKMAYGSYLFMPSLALLGVFPRLDRLSINIPLDILHLRDTSVLGRFILSHPNIEDFCIRCPYLYEDAACCKLESESANDAYASNQNHTDIDIDISLPAMNIHTLELGLKIDLSYSAHEDINPFYTHIALLGNSSNSNITTLILQDRNMQFKDIKRVLGLFPSHRLKKLLLMAYELSPELVNYLAETCPRLESLSIHAQVLIREASKASMFAGPNAWENSHWILFERALIKRTTPTIKRFRNQWTLSDLSIMRYKYTVDKHVYDWKCMRTIAGVVPSLRSFAGRGHMVLPELELEERTMPDMGVRVRTRLDLGAVQRY